MRFNLLDLTEPPVDYSRSKVLVPLSAGINSGALLCLLGEQHPEELKPLELHLYYAHFREHSPDSFKFVAALIRYARRKFSNVKVRITRNSVNKFFIEQKMIPHPTISPCSQMLKILPMQAYDVEHGIDAVLIGYVDDEIKRYKSALAYKIFAKDKSCPVKELKKLPVAVLETLVSGLGDSVRTKDKYPLLNITNEDCFYIVKSVIGWYPAIYDIKENGKRVFTHNNCLPCKNMSAKQFQMVGKYYPEYARRAEETAAQIPNGYWGRDDVPDVFKCDVCERM